MVLYLLTTFVLGLMLLSMMCTLNLCICRLVCSITGKIIKFMCSLILFLMVVLWFLTL
jgi:hypothetical protein